MPLIASSPRATSLAAAALQSKDRSKNQKTDQKTDIIKIPLARLDHIVCFKADQKTDQKTDQKIDHNRKPGLMSPVSDQSMAKAEFGQYYQTNNLSAKSAPAIPQGSDPFGHLLPSPAASADPFAHIPVPSLQPSVHPLSPSAASRSPADAFAHIPVPSLQPSGLPLSPSASSRLPNPSTDPFAQIPLQSSQPSVQPLSSSAFPRPLSPTPSSEPFAQIPLPFGSTQSLVQPLHPPISSSLSPAPAPAPATSPRPVVRRENSYFDLF
eukprot:TRINITY_DN8164_c0_g3_i2.p1 TRINITY_DN8164_c0_g3~~TRINITY_DN8164_c0_g3_i2.p1  ORF type:complete len:267 (+),score=38.06 TRINITY_DN8164_c0_g3_i2:426-1226(+)